ncbi:TIGR03546 family protein [Rhodopirellula halodulae]|uniref:TIGR03546 family protein n=1 Tax=Rhodopirellula halodulae TaxID=2894198 RepID=UPI001E376B8D|nr:TIGR03546 family protein [Rhodopirellula sp. JC737]MCC9655391.1 TIGR03546 family protein [Rhodopirellula sp. JC737]
MILFTIKLLSTLRRAIAGRRYPSQLAWGFSLGLLIGLIPHGNLLAVALVLGVLVLRINHAMAALTAIGVTMIAPKLDPISDQLAQWVFAQKGVSEFMSRAWDYPLVPWTDLNNTVVMGSFLIGLAALLPAFALSYPLCRAISGNWSEDQDLEEVAVAPKRKQRQRDEETLVVDGPHESPSKPHFRPELEPTASATSGRVFDFRRVDEAEPIAATIEPNQPTPPAFDSSSETKTTRIEMIDERADLATTTATLSSPRVQTKASASVNAAEQNDQQKIDEALSYLLRQLRDSQDKDAA